MKKDFDYIVGIDEVGRGPVAGPVAVGLMSVPASDYEKVSEIFTDFKDSKKLTIKRRNEWFARIKEQKENGLLDYKIIFVESEKIDKFGIAPSIRACIDGGLESFKSTWTSDVQVGRCLIKLDGGLKAPEEFTQQETIIKGDEKELVIALASIVAKVTRDNVMCTFAKEYPEYSFEKHKGYGTKAHYEAIQKHGFCPIHRRSFLSRFDKTDWGHFND